MTRIVRTLWPIISLLIWCVVGAHGADAPRVATVKIGSKQPSQFTLSLVGQAERDYAQPLEVVLQLDLHLAAIPKGYRTVGSPLLHEQIRTQDLSSEAAQALESKIKDRFDIESQWLGLLTQKARIFMLGDQAHNYSDVLRWCAPGIPVVEQVAPKFQNPDLKWDKDNPTWHFEVWDVLKDSTTVRMGTVRISWELTVPINLAETAPSEDLLSVSFELPPPPEQRPETDAPTPEDAPAPEGASEITAKPTLAAAGANAFLLAVGVPLGADPQKLGWEIVGGFGVHERDAEGLAGVVAAFEDRPKEGEKDWSATSLKRFGVLGGLTLGGDEQWVLGIAYRIGTTAYLYGGGAFGGGGGSTRSSPIFGLALRLNPVLRAVTGSPEPSPPAAPADRVKILVEQPADEPFRPAPSTSLKPIVVTFGEIDGVPVARAQPIKNRAQQASRRTRKWGYTLYAAGVDGDTLNGATATASLDGPLLSSRPDLVPGGPLKATVEVFQIGKPAAVADPRPLDATNEVTMKAGHAYFVAVSKP